MANINKNGIRIEGLDLAEIKSELSSEDEQTRKKALWKCANRNDIPVEWLENIIRNEDEDDFILEAAFEACKGRDDIPIELIEIGTEHYSSIVNVAAIEACEGREDDVSTDLIDRLLRDADCRVRRAAMVLCQKRKYVHSYWIERGLKDRDYDVSSAAKIAAMVHGEVDWFTLLDWAEDSDSEVRKMASRAVIKDDLSDETDGEEYHIRGLEACRGRDDIPASWVQPLLDNEFEEVQELAKQILAEIQRRDIE